MSKKNNNNKPAANQKADKANTALANTVIKELNKEKFNLDILEKMQQAFGSKPKQREAFINLLDEKLDNKQLHKLNKAIVENANELMPKNDPNFVCRTTNNKIFQQLLLLEAKHCGMEAKFNSQEKLQSLTIEDIPQEILNHYSILKQKFYSQRESKDSLDNRIAQSINFLFYAPLFRESEIYEKLGLESAKVEHELQNPNGNYAKNLTEEQITKHLKENSENNKNEDKIDLVIEESIKKLEKSKKIIVKDQQREKIKNHIPQFLGKALTRTPTGEEKKDLIDTIYQNLDKNQSRWSKLANYFGIKSYSISKENLKKIGKLISNKINNFQSPINSKILEQSTRIVEELNKLSNPTKPSEIKKSNIRTKTKPPILKKPEHLKKKPANHK